MYNLGEIESIVEKSVFSMELKGAPNELYDPIEYLISIGGKRLRPKIAVLCYNLFLDNIDKTIIYPALALEVFHGFTLIHDDIMDNAKLRRGQETVHEKWNMNTAILSGDVMCIKSYEYISYAPAKHLSRVISLFTKTATQVCEGQQYDMNFESMPLITKEDYIEMIGLKTAVLMACSAKVGAIIAGADDKTCDSLYQFAYQLGLAFQIKDDYLDAYGDSRTFGKDIGGDIVNNKKTWLLVEALRCANGEDQKELSRLLAAKDMLPSSKITETTNLYNKLGIKEAAEKAITEYHERALCALKDTNLSKEQKSQLNEFTDALLSREK